ncbi:hypothetical protein [Amycolatopsis sp. SID8362]|uniref:hypothetical protein n=1 Tax=Amycolatopsis sp. SID8362 TaxID=2690346 RepID=UPI001369BDC8|nr:hypothetical protein [Amycolatopsis sp. SID8362]NBH07871.1 hypothetical protein [Amycolatopsis sp. SID8362]NED44566.1 hypothetical protein [Amycolatopsis sp. SID8362]
MRLPIDVPGDVRRADLIRVEGDREWERWTTVPGPVLESVTGADATALVGLVADLPDADMMRCYHPVYALRAHGAEGVLFELAFCFRCHNALGFAGGAQTGLEGFDADSPAGQELLGRFRAADPNAAGRAPASSAP